MIDLFLPIQDKSADTVQLLSTETDHPGQQRGPAGGDQRLRGEGRPRLPVLQGPSETVGQATQSRPSNGMVCLPSSPQEVLSICSDIDKGWTAVAEQFDVHATLHR